MTNKEKSKLLELRFRKLTENGKNFKCPGVLRKLERQIRNLNAK